MEALPLFITFQKAIIPFNSLFLEIILLLLIFICFHLFLLNYNDIQIFLMTGS
jgi:hypothetical protein